MEERKRLTDAIREMETGSGDPRFLLGKRRQLDDDIWRWITDLLEPKRRQDGQPASPSLSVEEDSLKEKRVIG
jgi:hypothetical protein